MGFRGVLVPTACVVLEVRTGTGFLVDFLGFALALETVCLLRPLAGRIVLCVGTWRGSFCNLDLALALALARALRSFLTSASSLCSFVLVPALALRFFGGSREAWPRVVVFRSDDLEDFLLAGSGLLLSLVVFRFGVRETTRTGDLDFVADLESLAGVSRNRSLRLRGGTGRFFPLAFAPTLRGLARISLSSVLAFLLAFLLEGESLGSAVFPRSLRRDFLAFAFESDDLLDSFER